MFLLFECSFSFALTQKRKNQREKVKAAFATLLRRGTALQAIELAALKQNRLLYATCLFSVLRCTKEAIFNSTPHCFARASFHFAALVPLLHFATLVVLLLLHIATLVLPCATCSLFSLVLHVTLLRSCYLLVVM